MNTGIAIGTGAVPAVGRGLLTPARAAMLLIAVCAVIVSVWPLGLTSDYLNHLARNHIEARIWFDPVLQQFYGLSFDVIPDLTMDMLVPWLSHLTGIYAAGALAVWLAFILPPLAGLLIARNIHGHITWCSLAGFLVVFNANMQWGFVNFVASTGLALLGFAFWMRMDVRWIRSAVFAPFGIFLAFNHALGFLLFGYLILLWELASFIQGGRGTRWQFILQLTSKDAVAMIPGLAVLALATGGAQQLTHVGVTDFNLIQKVAALWSGTSFFNPLIGRLVTIAFIVAIFMGFRRGVLRIEPRMAFVCIGTLVLVLAMPTSIFGIWGLHFRYPAVLIVLVAASVRLVPGMADRNIKTIAAIASVLMIAAFANGAYQLAKTDARTRELGAVVGQLPVGARVLPARHETADMAFALHSAALAVIERSAFVPNLFTNTSPVDVQPSIRALHMPQAWPLLDEQLEFAAELELPDAANGHWSTRYFYGWPDHWDYMIYFRSAPDQRLVRDELCPIAEKPGVVLYGIGKERCGGPVAYLVNAALRPTLD